MPRYEFFCDTCGSFELWRSFGQAGESMECPQCKATARRVYSMPGLVKTPTALTRARDRAEKSAYEPAVVKRERPTSEEPPKPAPLQYHHGRPWQVGH